MRIDACECRADLRSSRREVICGGGAGFVAALASAFIGAGRAARAAPLAAVPTVDRLTVTMVTDNFVWAFSTPIRREGFDVEHGAVDTAPDRPPRRALQAEWGLAMHARSERSGETRELLVDFGYTPEALVNNLAILGVDPARLDALVLSHGHFDHYGGMVGFLQAHGARLKKGLPLFVGGEDAFCAREVQSGDQFGALDRDAIMKAGLTLMMAETPALAADHALVTGSIPLVSAEKPLKPTLEKVGVSGRFGCFADRMPPEKATGGYIPDDFAHEIATVYVVKGKGLVVLTSCSHRGVINTIRQAQAASGVEKVHALIGGFHIVPPLDDAYIAGILKTLDEINPDYVLPAHCTGERFYDLARQSLGDRVIHSAVGTRFTFG